MTAVEDSDGSFDFASRAGKRGLLAEICYLTPFCQHALFKLHNLAVDTLESGRESLRHIAGRTGTTI
jgi:hypothetical protein